MTCALVIGAGPAGLMAAEELAKAGVKVVYLCEENREDYLKLVKKCPELFGEGGLSIRIVSHITEIVSDPRVIIGVESSDFS